MERAIDSTQLHRKLNCRDVSSTLSIALLMAIFWLIPATAQEWTQTFGGPGAELGYDIVATSDGGAIAVGFTSIDLLIDGYAVKTDADGNLVWERSLSLSPLPETFYSAIPTPTGGVILAGSADDPSSPNYRPWLLELDADGSTVWSSEDDFTLDLPVDSAIVNAVRLDDGRLAVMGGSNTFTNPEDPWVLLLNGHGEVLDFAQFETLSTPGFGVSTFINSIAATTDGGFVATGTVAGGLGQGYLWKFDAEGRPEWDRLYDSDGFREGFAVRQTTDGGFVATGCELPNCNNAFVLRTNGDGEIQWTRTLDDPQGRRSFGRDVIELESGDLLLVQTLDAAAGSTSFDSELVSLWADGGVQSVESLEVGTASTAAYRLALGPGGSLWATGNANDTTDPGQTELFVTLLEAGIQPGPMLFTDGFEAGHTGAWSAASQ